MASIAVVVLDTLRQDSFFEHFGWMDGLKFTNAWSTSHWTGSAHASLLTGRYPREIDTTVKSRSIEDDVILLPEQLKEKGYNTRMLSTNLQIYVWDGWERGFAKRYGPNSNSVDPTPDDIIDWSSFSDANNRYGIAKYPLAAIYCLHPKYDTIGSVKKGYKIIRGNRSSIDSVQNRLSTFDIGADDFVIANIMDTHAPYYPPSEYRTIDRKVKPELEDSLLGSISNQSDIKKSYQDCVRYVSDRYRDLHSDLVDDFDYVITIADHGELLGENGLFTHSYGLFPELTHIPIVITGKNIRSDTVRQPVSIVDVHATIADIAGIDVDAQGNSLIGNVKSEDRLVEYHGLADNRREKFIESRIGEKYELYDTPLDGIVAPEGYAFETHGEEIRVDGDWTAKEAQARLDDLRNSIDRKPVRSDQTHTDEVVQQQLEALGYA